MASDQQWTKLRTTLIGSIMHLNVAITRVFGPRPPVADDLLGLVEHKCQVFKCEDCGIWLDAAERDPNHPRSCAECVRETDTPLELGGEAG